MDASAKRAFVAAVLCATSSVTVACGENPGPSDELIVGSDGTAQSPAGNGDRGAGGANAGDGANGSSPSGTGASGSPGSPSKPDVPAKPGAKKIFVTEITVQGRIAYGGSGESGEGK